MFEIQPVQVNLVGTHLRIEIPNYVVGADTHEVIAMIVDDQERVIKMERVELRDVTAKHLRDQDIVQTVAQKLNIMLR